MKTYMLSFAALMMSVNLAEATPINNGAGLTNPGHTIDFNANGLVQYAPLDNAYADEGVSFSNLYQDSSYNGSFPNTSGGDAVNFRQNPWLPFTISFAQAVNEAAFILVTNYSSTPSVIESFLNGNLVETSSVSTSTSNPNDFYGFSNSLFDQIKVTPETAVNGAALIDNLQFTTDVPEPISLALLSSGLIGLGLARRRRG
jgi:hypothetical protein